MQTQLKPKVLIIGPARSGKDTLAAIWQIWYGLFFRSSSQAAADIFLYDALKDKYGYKNPTECFEDRINHRAEWYDLICEYNKEDKARLAKEILKDSDCYVGMRNREEIEECMRQKLFDIIIWVDASERISPEDPSSFTIDKSIADIIIENNTTKKAFVEKAIRVGNLLCRGGSGGECINFSG